MNDPLYMAQLRLPTRLVFGYGNTGSDDGYRLHALLKGLFGEHAPQPFHGRVNGREVEVLGYAGQDASALLASARLFGAPVLVAALTGQLHTKPMPVIPAGQRLGFHVNVIPAVRVCRRAPFRKGAEVDAWLHAKLSHPQEEPPEREAVYLAWLKRQMEAQGGLRLDSVEMTAMRGVRLFRRDQQRVFQHVEQREAVFQGVLTVQEEVSFRALLQRGVGRHRAFGFGMLRLAPPSRMGTP